MEARPDGPDHRGRKGSHDFPHQCVEPHRVGVESVQLRRGRPDPSMSRQFQGISPARHEPVVTTCPREDRADAVRARPAPQFHPGGAFGGNGRSFVRRAPASRSAAPGWGYRQGGSDSAPSGDIADVDALVALEAREDQGVRSKRRSVAFQRSRRGECRHGRRVEAAAQLCAERVPDLAFCPR